VLNDCIPRLFFKSSKRFITDTAFSKPKDALPAIMGAISAAISTTNSVLSKMPKVLILDATTSPTKKRINIISKFLHCAISAKQHPIFTTVEHLILTKP
jgi:hypothetical protein